MIVVLAPLPNDGAIMRVRKPTLRQAPLPELAVKAFNQDIWGELFRLDKLQPGLLTMRPKEQRLVGQLRTLGANDGLR